MLDPNPVFTCFVVVVFSNFGMPFLIACMIGCTQMGGLEMLVSYDVDMVTLRGRVKSLLM